MLTERYTFIKQKQRFAESNATRIENLSKAIIAVRSGQLSQRQAAKIFGVPQATLSRKIKRLNMSMMPPDSLPPYS